MAMGPGGTAVDMVTGKPVTPPKPEDRLNKARARFHQAVQNAMEISTNLHQNNRVLKIILERAASRLIELAKRDRIFQGIIEPAQIIREELELTPILAEREVLRQMGPQLASLIEAETEAAP
jgi:hypothetical protein